MIYSLEIENNHKHKKHYILKQVFYIFLCSSFTLYAQSIKKGGVVYDFTMFSQDYKGSLYFSNTSSQYKTIINRAESYVISQEENAINAVEVDASDSYIFVDKKIDTLFLKTYFVDKNDEEIQFYLYEPIPKLKWKLLSQKKKVQNIPCLKATTHFRGRDYTAWYAPSIPVPYGPWKFGGLPGLILEISDAAKAVHFTAINITIPYNYKKVVLDETLRKAKLDTAYINFKKKAYLSLMKKFAAREKREGRRVESFKNSIELNYDDINY